MSKDISSKESSPEAMASSRLQEKDCRARWKGINSNHDHPREKRIMLTLKVADGETVGDEDFDAFVENQRHKVTWRMM